ncbi:hypothetical protein [Cupriavidus necator]|uniref:hypothetical protein n=1 Tax=Cupriavidus necator TaxID=106590 RepID=UPI0005B48BA3|nr:hypothetical protein [Cupriavidus necator]
MSKTATVLKLEDGPMPWQGFIPEKWMQRINVREFIIENVAPYEGDDTFLSGQTERTKLAWAALQPLFLRGGPQRR